MCKLLLVVLPAHSGKGVWLWDSFILLKSRMTHVLPPGERQTSLPSALSSRRQKKTWLLVVLCLIRPSPLLELMKKTFHEVHSHSILIRAVGMVADGRRVDAQVAWGIGGCLCVLMAVIVRCEGVRGPRAGSRGAWGGTGKGSLSWGCSKGPGTTEGGN